jgi:hypothetical protein
MKVGLDFFFINNFKEGLVNNENDLPSGKILMENFSR